MDRAATGSAPETAFQLSDHNLLQHLVPVFQDVVESRIILDAGDTARSAPQGASRSAFRTKLAVDLRNLGRALQSSSSHSGDATKTDPIVALLSAFQKCVVSGSSDNEEVPASELAVVRGPFPFLSYADSH